MRFLVVLLYEAIFYGIGTFINVNLHKNLKKNEKNQIYINMAMNVLTISHFALYVSLCMLCLTQSLPLCHCLHIPHKPLRQMDELGAQFPTIAMAVEKDSALDPLILSRPWLSYNAGLGEISIKSPWKEGITSDKLAKPDDVMKYSYRYDQNTFEKSIDIETSVKGQLMVASLEGSLNILDSISETSKKTEMIAFIRQGAHVEHIWDALIDSIEDPSSLMTSEAYEMIRQQDYQTFFETYGTHFIVEKEYGCSAELRATFTFDSTEEKHSFQTKVGGGFEYGDFSASAAYSMDKLFQSTSKSKKMKVELLGDYVSLLEVKELSLEELEPFASAFTSQYGEICKANPPSLHGVKLLSWEKYFSSFGTKLGLPLDDEALQLLSRATAVKSVALTGYKYMYNYFVHSPYSYSTGNSIMMKPQWTTGIKGNIGYACDLKTPLQGPPANITNFKLLTFSALEKKKWAPPSYQGGPIDVVYYAKEFMEEMQTELAKYVRLNQQYIPSFALKAESTASTLSHAVDLFTKPSFSYLLVSGSVAQFKYDADHMTPGNRELLVTMEGSEDSLLVAKVQEGDALKPFCSTSKTSGVVSYRHNNALDFSVLVEGVDLGSVRFQLEPIAEEAKRYDRQQGYFPLSCGAATRL